MSPKGIVRLRRNLRWTQLQLASVLGVHPITVSKWERGVLETSAYQSDLLCSFIRSHRRDPNIGDKVEAIRVIGIPAAIARLIGDDQ